jgi:hypothetical protein
MLKEELNQEEFNKLSLILKNFKHNLGLPKKFEDYAAMSDTDKMNTDYYSIGKLLKSFNKEYQKLPEIRFDHIDFHRVYHDVEEEIKICEYLEEYGFYIRTEISDNQFVIEFKNKLHDVVSRLETNISFEKEKVYLFNENNEENTEDLEYTFLDLENIDNRVHKHINILENKKSLKDITKSQFREVLEYINSFVYVEEDIEELEKVNKDKFDFRTIDQLKNIHLMDDLIKNKII